MVMPNFAYIRPTSVGEALEQIAAEGSRIHGGGTDLMGCLRERIYEVRTVVSLSGLDELRGIRRTAEGGVLVGALTTLSEVAEDRVLREHYPGLSQAASEVGSPQLRHQGTIGGNLCQKPRCWYYRGDFHCLRKGGAHCFAYEGENLYHAVFGGRFCYYVHPSDTAPVLLALGAVIHVARREGTRKVPADKFFVLPGESLDRETVLEAGEMVTGVELPPPVPGVRSSYRKVRSRGAWDFVLAGVALAVRMAGGRVAQARVVLAGAAPVPWPAREAEEAILGRVLDEGTARQAAEEAMRSASPLSQNGYKIPLFRNVIEEELLKLAR
jgi:xanthine dehydrogenase YagS FAD-binding subunit